ncbi:DUF262 domain-containing protein [Paraclostridium sordellii]|uniref:DUF262 domain-containing protein n=1 Tax=Paraclostridium sordellii TaxID=1505 RepID=UPI0005E65602|nr:DUF262 domain-containing protein [Paeniclostridium sordellii]CEQ27359.1 Uncharacterized conserved protein [[Clostridium] sordellii] [Paeniclostridium sordellii]
MSNGTIEADKRILQKIFSEDFWFVIPEYQRPYVWQKDNIEELIEDLYYAFENKEDNDYFLGSLVLKKTENSEFNEYEVLDGQQRLTTFFMMISVLRDLLSEEDYKSTMKEMIYQKENKLKKIPSRSRLTYCIRDNVGSFIDEFLIKDNGTQREEDLREKSNYDNISISNMANGILIINKLLKNKERLDEFVAFLLNKALFIYVSTDNTEDAFRMFTILNDRGIPLTSADILKSINIGEINDKNDLNKYSKVWEDIEGKYGNNFDRFLVFIRNILVKQKANANLLDEFEKNIYEKDKLKKGKATIDLLSKYDEIYDEIIELENKQLTNEYKNLITIMKIGLQSEDWIPVIMYYYDKFKINRLDDFLIKLEYKFAGDLIAQVSPTTRTENMNKIMKEIEKIDSNSLNEFIENSEVFNIDEKAYKNMIEGDIYKRRFNKYVLLKLEYLMSDNTVHLSGYKNISVEHVLPQNPNIDSEWRKIFTDEERDEWTHKLANLVLISKKKNSSLSNLNYIDKKEKYLKGRVDAFKGSKIFIDNNLEWNKSTLEKRQEKIVNMLINNKNID